LVIFSLLSAKNFSKAVLFMCALLASSWIVSLLSVDQVTPNDASQFFHFSSSKSSENVD
jgi:hypothetical protein